MNWDPKFISLLGESCPLFIFPSSTYKFNEEEVDASVSISCNLNPLLFFEKKFPQENTG